MWRISFLFSLVHLGLAADHNVFKNCSQIELCSSLRNRAPQDLYSVDISSVVATGEPGKVQMNLTSNDKSSSLTLTITTLENSSVRVQIDEATTQRYQLQNVLDSEPVAKAFNDLQVEISNLSITLGDNNIIVNFSPFNVEFYKGDKLVQVLKGNRLVFNDDSSGYFAFGVTFPEAVQLYGLHEHTDNLALQTTGTIDPYRLRNSDLSGHEMHSPMALYGSIPVLIGHGSGATSGIFLHNAAEQWIETKNGESATEAYFMVGGGSLDFFTLLGPTPQEVSKQYVTLTGTAHLPQIWALGHHQCRWSYMSQEEVKDVVQNFVNYNFPLDVIWLDIDYTDSYKYFTWNPNTFSDPVDLQTNITSLNKKLVTIIDPHIKVEEGYSVYDGAKDKGLFVKNPDGSDFEGDCWPGLSSYMDFLNPEARDYYASYYSFENFPNSEEIAGIWNDMNEPSVFDDSLEKTLPFDSVHFGNVAHKDIHNIYGFLHTMSTHQGLLARDNGATRPFILTRSHFAGSQRYAAIWTGDNDASWDHLAISFPECLNANLLGIVFCGADVGGFGGNPDVELLQRWYQAGAWLPFYRAHAAQGTDHREPYLFDDAVQQVIRAAIELRYRHIPVWYTLFFEHIRNKDPIVRPLFYHYPQDESVFKTDNEYLVGSNILVRPVTEPGVEIVQVYFPGEGEIWYPIGAESQTQVYAGGATEDIAIDMQSIPIYYKGGSLIPNYDRVGLSTSEMISQGVSLVINEDQDGNASGTAYYDDYTSFAYRDNNEYTYVIVSVSHNQNDTKLVEITNIDNTKWFNFTIERIILNKLEKSPEIGKPGKFSRQIYETDSSGRALRDINFKDEHRFIIDMTK